MILLTAKPANKGILEATYLVVATLTFTKMHPVFQNLRFFNYIQNIIITSIIIYLCILDSRFNLISNLSFSSQILLVGSYQLCDIHDYP